MVVGVRRQVVPARAVDRTTQHRTPGWPTGGDVAAIDARSADSTTRLRRLPGTAGSDRAGGIAGRARISGTGRRLYGANPWPGAARRPPGSSPCLRGATPYGQPGYVAAGGASMNGLAIASFVCSIVGFFFITFIVAIVLGFVARAQIRKSAWAPEGRRVGHRRHHHRLRLARLLRPSHPSSAPPATTRTSSVISLAGAIGHIA